MKKSCTPADGRTGRGRVNRQLDNGVQFPFAAGDREVSTDMTKAEALEDLEAADAAIEAALAALDRGRVERAQEILEEYLDEEPDQEGDEENEN